MRTHHVQLIREHLEAMQAARESHAAIWRDSEAGGMSHAEAHRMADPQWLSMADRLRAIQNLLPPEAALKAGDPEAIDGWLDFCEVDVPAFGAGYLKQRAYRRLRKVQLSETQRQRTLSLALHHLSAPQWRHEMDELALLAAKAADQSFVQAVHRLLAEARDPRDWAKRGLLLAKVLKLRPELRSTVPVDAEALEAELRAKRTALALEKMSRFRR